MSAWQYSLADDKRTNALLLATTFTDVVETVARDMNVLCGHRKNCDIMAGFSRVIFNLYVPETTFDLFFNSEHGYRGAYFKSPHFGLEANEKCIKHLTPSLLSWAKQHEPSLDLKFAKESLASPTAKVWLAETGSSHWCDKCVGEWSANDEAPELRNGRWELTDTQNGRWGRKVPSLSKLRVFGAFLNERYDEFTPENKRYRAQDINAYGWS